MKKCIMLGNGINRCMTTSISWGDLLNKIANKYDVELNNRISFPMQFENLANQILEKRRNPSDEIYIEIKNDIIEQIESAVLSSNSPHKILSENADSVITTNYDFLIETSLDPTFSINKISLTSKDTQNKYNINNFISVNAKPIYHIHGDLRRAKSICLGYEHYAGTLQNLRNTIVTKKDIAGTKKPAIIWKLEDPSYDLNTWATKFFTEDVHIVGFGLTQSEIDIWWLITYRASLLYADRFNGRKLINNSITFHDVGKNRDENMAYALKHNAVRYEFHEIKEFTDINFQNEYRRIASEIYSV